MIFIERDEQFRAKIKYLGLESTGIWTLCNILFKLNLLVIF